MVALAVVLDVWLLGRRQRMQWQREHTPEVNKGSRKVVPMETLAQRQRRLEKN